ncbi:MAG: lamin tail domain-containing protein, partial [Planctomycetota bacterium]
MRLLNFDPTSLGWFSRAICLCAIVLSTSNATAQLRITEVMFDSESAEPRWEWFEVQNTGATAIDLNGGYARDMSGDDLVAPNIDNTLTANTVIPAGGIGVIFNSGSNDHTIFRQAWGLGPNVPLIGIPSGWSSLNNSGDSFGIWANTTAYTADLGDGDMDGDLEVVQFNNALTSIDYNGFPDGGAGVSTYWKGTGDITDAAEWATSMTGVDGAYQSSLVTTMNNINSTDDAGNPGISPTGSAAGLHITEIMFNPRSDEPEWEWVEVVNNTGATIDFASGEFFLDDAAGNAIGGANITSGSIPDGGVAVLYNDDLAGADFDAAWGAG